MTTIPRCPKVQLRTWRWSNYILCMYVRGASINDVHKCFWFFDTLLLFVRIFTQPPLTGLSNFVYTPLSPSALTLLTEATKQKIFNIFLPVHHRHHLCHWAKAVDESGDHGHDCPVGPPGIVRVTLEDFVHYEVSGQECGIAVKYVAEQILGD